MSEPERAGPGAVEPGEHPSRGDAATPDTPPAGAALAADLSEPDATATARRYRRAFLLLVVAATSVLFVLMIRDFLAAVLVAAIMAGLTHPFYRWLVARFGGRRRLASVTTVIAVIFCVALPLAGFLALVAREAVEVAQGAEEWIRAQQPRLAQLRALLERIPFIENLIPEGQPLNIPIGNLAQRTGGVLVGTLAAATRGTLNFFLQLFVAFYAMYFFLVDGHVLLRRILGYMPLAPAEEEQLLDRFLSVSRATIKGSLLIGVIQGALAGLAFWVTGVPAPAFWGTVTVVLSILPAVGASFVWIPAVIYLLLQGAVAAGIGLLAWSAIVVSTVDNFLRPRLIGRDARMSDLLILLSTLGGIFLFGAVGFIIGPIVASLFVTVWHIYGEVFGDWLPAREPEA